MIALRSLVFNLAFYVNIIVLMILGLPAVLFGRRGVFFMARLWGAARSGCSTRSAASGRIPRPREHPARRLHPRRQAPVVPRDLRAARARARLRDHPQEAAAYIPLFGLYLIGARQIAIDRSRGRAALTQIVAQAGAGAERGTAGHHLPRRHPAAARRAAALQIRRRGDLRRNRRALPAGRAQYRAVLGPARFLRRPGVAVIEFLPAIPPGLDRDAFAERLKARWRTACARLNAEAVAKDPASRPCSRRARRPPTTRGSPAVIPSLTNRRLCSTFVPSPTRRWTDGAPRRGVRFARFRRVAPTG